MKYFVYIIIGIVAVAIIAGFFIVGSPLDARLRAFDERKVQDLQNIQWQIVNFYQNKARLPQTLAELTDSISGFVAPKDPQTGMNYTYTTQGTLTFSLCATFNKASEGIHPIIYSTYPAGSISENWEHGEGNVCFERTIDPDFYPVHPKR